MRRLVDYLTQTIASDPSLFLAYIAFAEYFVVILGPEWLTLLEKNCGIPKSSMTVIGKHIELDEEHAEEAFGLIDDLVPDPRKLQPMRRVLLESVALFDGFSAEIASGAGVHDVELPEAAVSAA
jgi:hypothetical protein